MQTILGAGGAIGKLLGKELPNFDSSIRLVSRHPHKINENDELMAGDLTDASFVMRAVEGAEVAYLTVGLEYKYRIWHQKWPVIMQNVLDACEKHGTKLVFFDNVYMYDPAYLSNLTEETPVNPPSKKGRVRAQIADMFMTRVREGRLEGMIVRSADFYGAGAATSIMMETVYKKMSGGKKAMWMGRPSCIHSMTYTPDAAKATALLGNTTNAYGEIWHLPTESEKLSGKEWIVLFANKMGASAKFSAIPGSMIKLMGLVVPFFRELGEMMYQFDHDYYFNSDKFKMRFPDFEVTPPAKAVEEILSGGKQ